MQVGSRTVPERWYLTAVAERDAALDRLAEIRAIILEDHLSTGVMIEEIWTMVRWNMKENTP